MGNAKSFISERVGKESLNVTILGLDSVGKTSLLYALKLGEHINTLPNIGLNIERVQYKQFSINMYDVGGGPAIQNSCSVYTGNSSAIIFVIDSTDRLRISEFLRLHDKCLEETAEEIPVVYYANKQDIPGAISICEIVELYGLNSSKRKWVVLPSSAKRLEGIWQGVAWICNSYTKI
jgi:ADP-ribosylation factor protein 1